MSRKWNLFSTYGKVPPGSAYSVAVINLLAARRGDQSPLKWSSHLSFCKGMEQPLAAPPTSPTREEREPQASRHYGTPLVDLKQMLEGVIPQDKMTCYFFLKEGIRKLSDLNTVIGNNTQFILICCTLIARMSSFQQELGPRKR